jgi:hypothetical protein
MVFPAKLASEHIKDALVNDGFIFGGNSGDWHLWIGKQPGSPDRTITIYDSAGAAPNPKWLLDYPSVQLRVRGGQKDYQIAGQKILELRNRLVGKESFDAYVPHGDGSRDRVVAINAIGDIALVGWDDAARPEFVMNLALIIEPSPTTSPTNREPL